MASRRLPWDACLPVVSGDGLDIKAYEFSSHRASILLEADHNILSCFACATLKGIGALGLETETTVILIRGIACQF
jgi:hypothetical protein